MAYSYGLNRAERIDDYKTGREFILTLIDLVSRGGNLLLDIGPAGDGTIPPIMEQRLLEIGDWLEGQRRGHLRHALRRPLVPVERRQATRSAVRRIHGEIQSAGTGRPAAEEWQRRQTGLLHQEARCALRHHAWLARQATGAARRSTSPPAPR